MKRINTDYLLIGLLTLLIGTGLYFLISHIVDCARGHDTYSEILITDKEYREPWAETYTTVESQTINGHLYSHPVLHTNYHAAQYRLHYTDQDGHRTADVGEGLYQHYHVGDRAKLRTRIGQSGCKCQETIIN